MIPIVIYDKEGNFVGMQSFNDNTTVAEQLNRALLRAVTIVPKQVLDQKNVVEKLIAYTEITSDQLDTLYTAVDTYNKAVDTALKALKTSVDEVVKEVEEAAE